jgi:S-adenosylmethionine:tRNA ribosyltransferase-isomerase
MQVSDFDYKLPPGLIAQTPPAERGASRLLVLDRAGGPLVHTTISELACFLRADDLLVVNDTRVFPARLLGRRDPSGGAVECLLLGRLDADRWDALVHPGHKLRPGERVVFEGPAARLRAEVLERKYYGRRVIRLWTEGDAWDVDHAIDELGHVPLPPYIKRSDTPADRERYQTVFARVRGSVAAPTAGLHFTADLLAAIDAAGIERAAITLHVGYGTFKPVRVENVEEHRVDEERYEIAPAAAAAVDRARVAGRRVVAVGTTTTRALETAVRCGEGRIGPHVGVTNLFIHPGFEFRAVGALLTNFHLPRSSLLMLVAAFGGRERVLGAYAEAIRRGYRFYSYGDAMLIA